MLVEAFSRLPENTYLLLAGEGPRRHAIEAAVNGAGLGNRVRILGSIQDVRPVIVASNATVLASTAVETFSLAMLESMALEVPVIASRIGGLPEAISDGSSGRLFPIGDVDQLTSAMRDMVSRPEQARAMGRTAARYVSSRFTHANMIARHERLYEDVVATRAGRQAAANPGSGQPCPK